MKAIVVQERNGGPLLVWQDVPDVEFGDGDGDVLVSVRATAVNRADLLQARGGRCIPG